MVVKFCVFNLTTDKYDPLWTHAIQFQNGGWIAAYLKQEYDANPTFHDGGASGMYDFEQDRYVEFCLKWL